MLGGDEKALSSLWVRYAFYTHSLSARQVSCQKFHCRPLLTSIQVFKTAIMLVEKVRDHYCLDQMKCDGVAVALVRVTITKTRVGRNS